MASSAEDIIETAALGRPFTLGMLYDCRKDFLVPGVTLWDNEDLQQNTCQTRQQNTEFNITASDSIDEKSNSLNVSGSLKLSLLGGLVNVSGSAKYFQDTKKSHKQQRLTLHYKTTTRYESLTMSHLGRGQVPHPNVFKDGTATHVVTAILYGASAYFMFDRESSNDEDKKHVEGEAELMMDKLKFIKISAQASFDMDEREKSAVEKFSCTFHGDFHLTSNPSSFIKAMEVYRQLPKLLGENGEHAVPVRVWMYPLVKLDSEAAKLQREISNSLITYTSRDIEHLNNTEMRCNDLLKNTAAKTFPVMEEKLRTFMQNCHHYKLEFVQNLGSVLPSIRGGGQEESALANILKAHEKSPFNSKNLDQWLTLKEKESDTIASILKQLEKLGAKLDDDLDDLLSDLDITNVVSFTFTSIDQPDSSLMKQLHFLTPAGMMSECPDTRQTRNTTRKRTFDARDTMKPSHPMNEEWLSAHTKQIMRRQLQLFKHLKEQLDSSDDTKFIVASKYDERFPGACIFIYEDGSDEPVRFIPPSKPATPSTSDVSYDRFTVGVSDPDSTTVEYLVEFKRKQEGDWTAYSVQNKNTVTLLGLQPDTEYEIRATAVGKLGYSVSSCTVSILTDISPPTDLDVSEKKAQSITLTWRNPSDQQYQSLRVEYRMKQETGWTAHPVQKNQETATLSGLKPDTEHEIRVIAVGKLGYVSSDVLTAVTKALSPPTNVKVTREANSFTITWSNPEHYEDLKQYIVEYKEGISSDWQKEETKKEVYTFTLKNLKPYTNYSIRMCTEAGREVSKPGEEMVTTTKESAGSRYERQHTALDRNRFTPLPGTPPVYLLDMKPAAGPVNKKEFGEASCSNRSNKTIMLVGATGSGMTTLINGMINYVLGVEWEDNWRFKLIDKETNKSQAHSQTSEVTAYQIHHTDDFKIPYSLTIIDTPGFGNTRGIKGDKVTTDRIIQFFTDKDGIDAIDAVCFVVQSASAHLTPKQKYIFDAILSVFGKDIASNIITLVTFADGQTPPVLETIKEANIPCVSQTDGSPVYFRFNNSVLFAENKRSSDEGDCDHMFWKMGKASMKKFFTQLGKMETQSLTLTKEVLQQRKQLEATIEGVQPLIRIMKEIQSTQAVLEEHKTQMEEKMNIEQSIAKLEKEYHQVQGKIVKLIETVTKCLIRLKEIALRPDPLSTPDYIDLLIESEKQEAKPGLQQRIQELQELREGADLVQKVAENIALGTEASGKAPLPCEKDLSLQLL
ncbi:uncharacterized protein LOC134444281 [Engraulis encrasicolus]|uniref:uncharacterized protein LOC134444281 n=1 Tax=Engraulis encrasicolus TaxID=184585 RepID=UPI002FD6C0D9